METMPTTQTIEQRTALSLVEAVEVIDRLNEEDRKELFELTRVRRIEA